MRTVSSSSTSLNICNWTQQYSLMAADCRRQLLLVDLICVQQLLSHSRLIMAALWNRGHYIFALWLLSIFLSFFLFSIFFYSSPNLQRRRSTEVNQTLHYVWPSPGLVCYIYTFGISCPLTEFCHVQISLCVHLCTISQVSRAISSQLRHLSTIGKKTY